jgi:hypothetical protein
MATTVLVTVKEGTPAADAFLAALRAMGATPVREGGEIRCEVPAAACAVCKEMCARTSMVEKEPLGGLVCETCMGIARRLWRSATQAANQHLQDFAGQLPRIIRDVRQGYEEPTFYRGING